MNEKEDINPLIAEFLSWVRQQVKQQEQQKKEHIMSEDTNSDLSFMDISLDDIVDYAALPDGTEVDLQVTDVQPNSEKKYNLVTFTIKDQPNTLDVRHYVSFPNSSDDAKKANNKKKVVRDFMQALGLQSPVFGPEIIGQECSAILGYEEATDKYREKNFIKKFVTPK